MRKVCHIAILLVVAMAASSAGNCPAAEEKQPSLIEVLKSNAGPQEKAIACKQLAIYGNQDAVPALAAMLPDPQLSSWARIALEAIPGPAPGDALCEAMVKVQGRLLVGIINSLGVRRDTKAVAKLVERLKDPDVEVASAAAVALGHIGGDAAAKVLEQSLATAPVAVRTAVAEGCILCAEQILAEGKPAGALEVYGAVRKADVSPQQVLEAIRGMIIAQGTAGVPLLVEQLQSADKSHFALGLRVARELPGGGVTEALVAELGKANPLRQGLLILALADRGDVAALPAVIQAARSGAEPVRCVAIRALRRLGDATCSQLLLDAAVDANAEVSQTALAVLADLPSTGLDNDLAARLAQAEGKMRQVLIELAGRRPIVTAVPALLKAAGDADSQIRVAALTALGATIEFRDLSTLVERVSAPQHPDDSAAAEQALCTACQRMPDREACAEKLLAAMLPASVPVKCRFLAVLSTLGGAKALQAVGAAAKDADPEVRDAASRLLGAWMNVDAAPVLLDLAKSSADAKYKIRALRGYIRLLRQFDMPQAERETMCRTALETAERYAEKKLVLEVIGRYPSADMLALALETAKIPELKNEAVAVALLIAQKTGGKSVALQKMLTEMGHGLVKIEIVKAEYGAGSNVKDVTTILRKHVHDFPVIVLPSPSYNATFGGDPAPGSVKQLRVQYRMAGKPGDVTFTENASIQLPKPK